MSVVGDRVYTMGNDGKDDVVYCLDVATGEPAWTYRYPCKGGGNGYAGSRIQPTVADGRVYTLSLKGQLHCIDARTGQRIWDVDAPKRLRARGAATASAVTHS